MNKTLKVFAALCIGLTLSTCYTKANAANKEVRGTWISSIYNMDYPQTKNNVDAQKKEFSDLLDNLKDVGINTVFVQVRPSGDALYVSAINPWSSVLTGTQGKYPGYDPLEYMIEEAHKRGMDIHAWLNPYRVTTSGTDLTKLAENHPARLNPNMIIEYNNALYYNPESEAVKTHIVDTVREIVQNYNIDGIHFDDYFYPNGYPLPEGESRDGEVANQRREHVNDMVKRVHDAVKSINPNTKFGISPIGVWKNIGSDSTGSNTRGDESYYSVYCDTRTWIKNEWIDYVVPQIYWQIGHTHADYETLVEWWSNEVKGTNVDLYIGQGIYKEEVAKEIDTQLNINEQYEEVKGSVYFRAKLLVDDYQGAATKIKNIYELKDSNNTTTDNNVSNIPSNDNNGATNGNPGDTTNGSSNSGSNIEKPITQTTKAKVITYDVNMRSKPDFKSKVLATIKVGQTVEYISKSGDFAKVKYNGKTGYVAAKYVQKVTASSSNGSTSSTDSIKPNGTTGNTNNSTSTSSNKAKIITYDVNMRSKADFKSNVLATIKVGQTVEYISKSGDFVKIKYNGKTGYVMAKYVQKVTASSGTTSSSGTSNSSTTTNNTVTNKTGTVTATSLNVRSGAGTKYSIVTKLKKGDKVTILETKNGWYKVKTPNGKTGWVSSSYIQKTTTTSNSSTTINNTVTNKTGTVTATSLNVRSGAGTKYSVVTKLKKGDKVTILETKNGWYKVKTPNGKTGWVSSAYIKL